MAGSLKEYASEDLARKVQSLLGWYQLGDRRPRGAILWEWSSKAGHDRSPADELGALLQRLPPDHEVREEIFHQAQKYLQEITSKNQQELASYNPFYLNVLDNVGAQGYATLFTSVKTASIHVLQNYPLIKDEESPLIHAAVSAMNSYAASRPGEVEEFLDAAWERKAAPSLVVQGYAGVKSKKAITLYFKLLGEAVQQRYLVHPYNDYVHRHFMIKGVQRGMAFGFIAGKLKQAFPQHDFTQHYEHFKDTNLKEFLAKMLK